MVIPIMFVKLPLPYDFETKESSKAQKYPNYDKEPRINSVSNMAEFPYFRIFLESLCDL